MVNPQLHHLPGTSARPANERDIALARNFFVNDDHGPSVGPSFETPHHLPPAEVARMGEMNGQPAPDLNGAWAREQHFHHNSEQSKAQAAWAAEFGNGSQQSLSGPSMQQEMGAQSHCE